MNIELRAVKVNVLIFAYPLTEGQCNRPGLSTDPYDFNLIVLFDYVINDISR